MDAVASVIPKNAQKNDASKASGKKHSASSDKSAPAGVNVFRSISQILVVSLAFGTSVFLQNNYGQEIKSMSSNAFGLVQSMISSMQQEDPMLALLEELTTLRKQNVNLQHEIMDFVTRKKDFDAGMNEDLFYMHQFENFFRITPIDKIDIDAAMVPYMAKYKLSEDPYYIENKAECDDLFGEYKAYLNRGLMFDERFVVKWSDERQLHSLYARADMPMKAVLGVFTGTLRIRHKNIDDAWKFKAHIIGEDGEPLNLVVDSRFKGNWFHFLRIGDKGNVDALLVPDIANNMWHVLFKTKRPIEMGEELVLSFGDLE